MHRLSWKWIFLIGLIVGDCLLIYFSFFISYEVRFNFQPFLNIFPVIKGTPAWQLYQQALRVVVPIWILIFALWGRAYRIRFHDTANEFLSVVKSVSLAILLIISLTFLYRRYEYSRLVIGLCWFISIILVFVFREIWKSVVEFLYDKIALQENVVLVAKGKIAQTIGILIQKHPHRNLITFSDLEIDQLKNKIGSGLSIQEIIVQGQFVSDQKVLDILDQCEENGVEIKILPDFLEMRLGEVLVDDSLGMPILHLKPLSLHGFRFFMKRLFDVTLSIFIVSVLFVPFVIVSLLIILDSPGGIFFRQERMGFKEKLFKCLKFRTMHKNAEKLLKEWELQSFRGGPAFKMKGDPRITRVGRWLRRFSLDEVPQIWNVLKGEMSLIGPRPQVLAEANGNPEWAKKRYRILPGITGLWQVSGRADLSYEDMMRLDIFYLENWSSGMDLRIILKTIPVVLGGKGAY